jgi:hypothetical protein
VSRNCFCGGFESLSKKLKMQSQERSKKENEKRAQNQPKNPSTRAQPDERATQVSISAKQPL